MLLQKRLNSMVFLLILSSKLSYFLSKDFFTVNKEQVTLDTNYIRIYVFPTL